MRTVQAINWRDTADAKNRVADVILNSNVDGEYRVILNGTDINGQQVFAHYITIDNLDNIAPVTVVINGIDNSISPYTRSTIGLGNYCPDVGVSFIEGTVRIYISERNLGIPDEQNQLASGSAFDMGIYLNRDGSSPMQASLDFGGFRGINLLSPVALTDAVNLSILRTYRGGITVDGPPYNAVGDNVADDTDAFRLAFADAIAANLPIILGRRRTYKVGQIDIASSCIVIGNFSTINLISTDAVASYFIRWTANIEELYCDNLTIIGTNTLADHQYGFGPTISAIVCDKLTMKNVTVNQCMNGFDFSGVVDADIDRCVASNTLGTNPGQGYGILLGIGSSKVVVSNSTLDGCTRHGLYIGSCVGAIVYGCIFKNHRATINSGSYAGALSISRSENIEVFGNRFEDNYDGQIEISPDTSTNKNCKNVQIYGNQFINRKNAVPICFIGEQAVPTVYFVSDVSIHNNTVTESYTDTLGSDLFRIFNGKRINIEENKLTILDIAGATDIIQLGDNLFVNASGDCEDTYITNNKLNIGGGFTVNYVDICGDILTNVSRHNIGPNYGINVTEEITGYQTRTNYNLIPTLSCGTKRGADFNNDATPTVIGGINLLVLNYTNPTNVTNFDDGMDGQILTVRFRNGNVTITNNFYTPGGVNITPGINDVMTFIKRSENNAWEVIAYGNN